MGRINYKEIYEKIYELGYQSPDNWRKSLSYDSIDSIVNQFQFNTILDIGCASGRFVRRFRELGKKAYGIDISEKAIKTAHKLGITSCKLGNILDIPFSNGIFDAVFTTDTLEHIHPDDVDQAIKEIGRVSSNYIFVHVSSKKEAKRKWIDLLHNIYKDLLDYDDLHLSIYPEEVWRNKFIKLLNVTYCKKVDNHILVFSKGEVK